MPRTAARSIQPGPSSPSAGIAYSTRRGQLLVGKAEEVLRAPVLDPWRGRVQLVFTSPPFPLLRKKKYGNLSGDEYAAWLANFARPLAGLLAPDASIVIELGNGARVEVLDSGMTPDADRVGGAMVDVVANTRQLSAADREAIAVYLKSLRAK